MNLTAQEENLRSELILRLQMTNRADILQALRELMDRLEPRKDFWDELSEIQRAMVHRGMAELEAGQGIPADEVLRGLKR
jgi:predicted transcriptional regulator